MVVRYAVFPIDVIVIWEDFGVGGGTVIYGLYRYVPL